MARLIGGFDGASTALGPIDGWPEVAEFNANMMKVVLAGGTLAYKDQELTLYREGKPEQVWMNLDYSPVLGEDGRPAALHGQGGRKRSNARGNDGRGRAGRDRAGGR